MVRERFKKKTKEREHTDSFHLLHKHKSPVIILKDYMYMYITCKVIYVIKTCKTGYLWYLMVYRLNCLPL